MNGCAKFMFADIVVVDGENIGCIVKTWFNEKRGYHYDVYVRMYNGVREYDEAEIIRYVVSKYISEEEKEWHNETLSGREVNERSEEGVVE